jgi:hypothetical protein
MIRFPSKKNKNNSAAQTIAGLVIAALVLIPIFGFTFYISKNEPKVEIQGENVAISSFLSKTIQFSASEIESVELLENMPANGMRTNGIGTSTILWGNFKFNDYGKSKVYVYRKHSPYLAIRLKDKPSVFINSKTPENTRKLYEDLLALQEQE